MNDHLMRALSACGQILQKNPGRSQIPVRKNGPETPPLDMLDSTVAEVALERPMVGVHIRRTDKVISSINPTTYSKTLNIRK